MVEKLRLIRAYDDDTIKRIGGIIAGLPDDKLTPTEKKLWHLRLYFKPTEVVAFLLCKGIKDDCFFEQLFTTQ